MQETVNGKSAKWWECYTRVERIIMGLPPDLRTEMLEYVKCLTDSFRAGRISGLDSGGIIEREVK